jgi:hypothetical protein
MEFLMTTEAEVELSLVRALLGAIPSCLRSASFQVEGNVIRLRYLFDGPISDDDEEGAQIAGTEVIADFTEPITISEEVLRFDYPEPLHGQTLARRVYERKESTTRGEPDPRLALRIEAPGDPPRSRGAVAAGD